MQAFLVPRSFKEYRRCGGSVLGEAQLGQTHTFPFAGRSSVCYIPQSNIYGQEQGHARDTQPHSLPFVSQGCGSYAEDGLAMLSLLFSSPGLCFGFCGCCEIKDPESR